MGAGGEAAREGAPSSANITLTYLSLYEGMGVVRAGCADGCTCASAMIDAHRGSEEKQRLISVYKTAELAVTLDGRRRCVLELVTTHATRSNGHKFKLSELSLRAVDPPSPPRPLGPLPPLPGSLPWLPPLLLHEELVSGASRG